jgi:hypothetical protein
VKNFLKKIFLKFLVLNLFDEISIGSSLNPDTQEEDPNIEYGRFDQFTNQDGILDEDEDEENFEEENYQNENNNQMDEDNTDINIDENYQPYNYTNTIDKIFKTEKKKRDLSENDPRRFEDA